MIYTTSHEDEITCPFCGQIGSDSWEYSPDADMFDADCCRCGRQFSVTRETCVTYSTRGKPDHK